MMKPWLVVFHSSGDQKLVTNTPTVKLDLNSYTAYMVPRAILVNITIRLRSYVSQSFQWIASASNLCYEYILMNGVGAPAC